MSGKKKIKNSTNRERDGHVLASMKGEGVNMSTKCSSPNKKTYTRKKKHKKSPNL